MLFFLKKNRHFRTCSILQFMYFKTSGRLIKIMAIMQSSECHNGCKQVGREKHRMEAFVRFKKAKDGLFLSLVKPDFNVLPIISRILRNVTKISVG
jgi:hypothetical protein